MSERYQDSELAGELEPRDLEWLLAGGFAAETQTYYNFLEDGTFLMVQFVHSSTGIGCVSNFERIYDGIKQKISVSFVPPFS